MCTSVISLEQFFLEQAENPNSEVLLLLPPSTVHDTQPITKELSPPATNHQWLLYKKKRCLSLHVVICVHVEHDKYNAKHITPSTKLILS